MYDKKNQALVGSAEAVIAATAEYCTSESTSFADLMFANETVFVNGRMMQMARDVYARVMELGGMLERCDISNINIRRTATVDDLVGFVHMLGAALRDPAIKDELAKADFGGIRARRIRWRASLEGDGERSVVSRAVRTYASAIVLLRRFHADSASDKRALPPSVRRLAQRIVTHAEEEAPLLVALAAARSTTTDEATVSVSTALVAVLMARQLTTDRNALTDLALAALLHDVGRRRLLAHRGGDAILSGLERPLSDDEQDRLPASGALEQIALEGVGELAVPRTVISFEARWQDRVGRLGPIYGGRRPAAVLGRILRIARAFSELMAPGPHAASMGPEDVIDFLGSRATDETERMYVKLLTGGLGIFPPGTSVELSTGEIGVVIRVPDHAVDFARPPIRVMYDARGNLLAEPLDVDLAEPPARGVEKRFIRRALDTDAQQTQAMRAFVLSVTRGKPARGDRAAKAAAAETGSRAVAEPPPPAPQPRPGAFEEPTLARGHAVSGTPPMESVPAAIVVPAPPAPAPAAQGDIERPFGRPRSNPNPAPAPVSQVSPAFPADIPKPFGRPRSNPGPVPRTDDDAPPDPTGRSRAVAEPLPPADVVKPFGRPRSNPGPLPRDDGDSPRESTGRFRGNEVPLPPMDVVRPPGRPRTNPGPLPRDDEAAQRPRTDPGVQARIDSGPGAAPGATLGRPRTHPGPIAPTDYGNALGRPRTQPGPFPPVDIVNIPGRPRTQPGVDPGDVPRPFGRPRTNPGHARQEYSAASDPRSEDSSITRPTATTAKPAQAPSNNAATVARTWQDFDADGAAASAPPAPPSSAASLGGASPAARSHASPVAPPHAAPATAAPNASPSRRADTAPSAPAAKARSNAAPGGSANSAPTVARAWSDFQADDEPVDDPQPKAKGGEADASRRPTQSLRAATGTPVNNAATVARAWSDYEPDAAGAAGEYDDPDGGGNAPLEDDDVPENATRKANWGGYGKVVATATPDQGKETRPTQKVNAKEVERLHKEQQKKK